MTDKSGILGGLSAEYDPLLKKCFVRSDLINTILDLKQQRNIVVGKKGSGKSAIFKIGQKRRSNLVTVRVSPRTHNIELKNPNVNYRRVSDFLKYELALECLSALSKTPDFDDLLSNAEKRKAKTVINEYIDRLKNAGKQIGSAHILGCGLSLKDGRRRPQFDLVKRSDYPKLVTLYSEIAHKIKKKCLVLIDDPEDLYPTRKVHHELIASLIVAAIDINRSLRDKSPNSS